VERALLLRIPLAGGTLRPEGDRNTVDSQGNAQQASGLRLEKTSQYWENSIINLTYDGSLLELEFLQTREREAEFGAIDMDFGFLGLGTLDSRS
jgi:hypothetical protein